MKKIDIDAVMEHSRKVLTEMWGSTPHGALRVEAQLATIRYGVTAISELTPGDNAGPIMEALAHNAAAPLVTCLGVASPPIMWPPVLASIVNVIEYDFRSILEGLTPGIHSPIPTKDVGDA